MDQVNLWILVPSLIIFALVSVPVVYIWIVHYSDKLLCCSSKQNKKEEEISDVETGTTEAPELQTMAQ
jgi:hypothetical protein